MNSLNQQSQVSLSSPKDLLLSAVPPLKAALKVLKSPNPVSALAQEKHSWYGMFVALGLVMVFAMLLILSSDGAPFVNPWTSLWTNKFEFYVLPSRNWPVLIQCASYAVCACLISYVGSVLAGLQLNGGVSATRNQAIRLAGYAALGAAFAYVVALLLILALGWILHVLKLQIFVFGWMTTAAVALLPVSTWGISRVFRRTSLLRKSNILPSLTISMATITMCAIGAIFIMDGLTDASMNQGRTVNSARNNPTAAVVQTCARVSTDVVCAVTLFPTKWQDYELIGDWKLGSLANPKGNHLARFYWHPAKDTGRQFALVNVESGKDITVEIRIATDSVCETNGTRIAADDVFFAMQGRVRGEERNAPLEMRIRIDNAGPAFVDMMKQVCRSHPEPDALAFRDPTVERVGEQGTFVISAGNSSA